MKTILVPTDFSASAYNAACYALQLAKRIKASINLCNAMLVPIEAPAAAQVAWPLEDYTSIKNEATEDLGVLRDKLEKDEREISDSGPYYSRITCTSEVGAFKDVIRNILDAQKANMVVMGMSGAGSLSRFFVGSNSRDLIDVANFPVLLIPPATVFEPVRKIAFATDLGEGNIEVIHSLASLARVFNAEILITHCIDPRKKTDWADVDAFLKDVTGKANYDKIYYRHVQGSDVEQGLKQLADFGQIDMLAMVHRQHHFMDKLLKGSHTQKMARQVTIPLLVFPPGYCTPF